MAEIKWIKLSTTMFDDDNIKLIESLPDCDSIILIWVKLLAQAGKCNASGYLILNNKIPYTEEMLASIFRRPLNTVRLALNTFKDFGMIEFEDDLFRIAEWGEQQNIDGMEVIKEQNRKRQQEFRNRQKQKLLELKGGSEENINDNEKRNVTDNVTNNVTVTEEITLNNALDIDIDIEKEYINNIVQNSENEKPQSSNDDQNLLNNFFESVWSKYPNKSGKTKVSLTQRKKLYKLGDELFRCIDRYLSDKELEIHPKGWKKLQGGDRFFNKTYAEYLDAEFEQQEQEVIPKTKGKSWKDDIEVEEVYLNS